MLSTSKQKVIGSILIMGRKNNPIAYPCRWRKDGRGLRTTCLKASRLLFTPTSRLWNTFAGFASEWGLIPPPPKDNQYSIPQVSLASIPGFFFWNFVDNLLEELCLRWHAGQSSHRLEVSSRIKVKLAVRPQEWHLRQPIACWEYCLAGHTTRLGRGQHQDVTLKFFTEDSIHLVKLLCQADDSIQKVTLNFLVKHKMWMGMVPTNPPD